MEYTSKLEKRSERYDTRFKQIMEDGELFDPMLSRYDTILRYLLRQLPHQSAIHLPNRIYSTRHKLKAGASLYNQSKEYALSSKTAEVYKLWEWETLINGLLNTPVSFKVKTPTIDGNTWQWLSTKDYLLERTEKGIEINSRVPSSAFWEVAGKVDSLFAKVEENIAEESYSRIKDWNPCKFSNASNGGRNPISLKEKALVSLAHFSSDGRRLSEVVVLIKHPVVSQILDKVLSTLNRYDEVTRTVVEMFGSVDEDLCNLLVYLILKLRSLGRRRDNMHGESGLWFMGDLDSFKTTSMFGSNEAEKYDEEFEKIASEMYDKFTLSESENTSANEKSSIEEERQKLEQQREEIKQITLTLGSMLSEMSKSMALVTQQIEELNKKI